ncbi:Putative ribosome maturation factor RimP [Candidatus Phycorickettsia trachydisci]|uniref:Ribosome maturation factor RimP n=1 Tax=Candidatus Phycorickettsia trachydisci TaxID=2115978 RepID=A0A2P1P6U2_9RICK|nr:ribosome maturation factor RimP [Candidatus Phycorickettsia trachydisci]AVP86994.1 Putative ribosome maturation factor RimP [Candidatus Phycorickettsia trachydisci]
MRFTELEKKAFHLLEDTIKLLGFELILVNLKDGILRLVAEKANNTPLSVKDCKEISNNVSPLLDVEGLLGDTSYVLEVSSAGLTRPLVKQKDFERFVGRHINLELYSALDKRKKFQGRLVSSDDLNIYLMLENKKSSKDEDQKDLQIPMELIKSANLMLTDEEFRKILKG